MKRSIVFCLLACGWLGAAQACLTKFAIQYSGSSYGNSAEATGFISFAIGVPPNPGNTADNLSPDVTSLSLVVTGASSGNGAFGLSDFDLWIWDTNGATLDLTQELVGQATLDSPWGTDNGLGGDFSLFAGNGSTAPTGSWFFTLVTDNGAGDSMVLTSMVPVPVPATLWLVGAGLLWPFRAKGAKGSVPFINDADPIAA